MVIDNVQGSVGWFKARLDLPEFRLGSEVYWRIQNSFGRSEEEIFKAKQEKGSSVTVSLVD